MTGPDWAVIDSAVPVAQERPAGSVTVAEYARHYGYALSVASFHLDRAVREGKMRTVVARVLDARGRRRESTCYVPEAQCPTSKPSLTGRNGKKPGRIGG
jgi:hypothetical protein